MTADDITRLTPLVEDLRQRGVIATWATTSYPFDSPDQPAPRYEHGFWLRSQGLEKRLLVNTPFTEDELVRRLAVAEARQNHIAAIEATYALSKDAMIRDLANVYVSRLYGRDLPIPSEITVNGLKVVLAAPAQ